MSSRTSNLLEVPKSLDLIATEKRNAFLMRGATALVALFAIAAFSYTGLHTIGGAAGYLYTGLGSATASFGAGYLYLNRFEEWGKGNIKGKDYAVLAAMVGLGALNLAIPAIAALKVGYYVGGAVVASLSSIVGFGGAVVHKKYLMKREVSEEERREHELNTYIRRKQEAEQELAELKNISNLTVPQRARIKYLENNIPGLEDLIEGLESGERISGAGSSSGKIKGMFIGGGRRPKSRTDLELKSVPAGEVEAEEDGASSIASAAASGLSSSSSSRRAPLTDLFGGDAASGLFGGKAII